VTYSNSSPSEATCGKGLAANAALPTKLADVMGAVARVLETHTKALDLADDDAKQEYDAYVKLVEQHRRIASELRALGDQMSSYRELPMGRHDMEALSAPEAVDVFESLVNLEQELLSLLEQRLQEHRPLLSEMHGAG
jgi:hypothetical protein